MSDSVRIPATGRRRAAGSMRRTRPGGGGRSFQATILLPLLAAQCMMLQQAGVAHPMGSESGGRQVQNSDPPRPGGYFDLAPVGSWSTLPSDSTCASKVHQSTWEPRTDNHDSNHTKPDADAVHQSLAARPRSGGGAYSKRWDTWLLPRVDGQFTGTTDEIFQWGACKWGLPDNVLRGIAVRESTWYQYEIYSGGRCVVNYGCGDIFSSPSSPSKTFCNGLAQFGHDYQKDLGIGICPKTFSIMGIMSWEDPAWGRYPDNQNGTFPFNRNSTAFAVDYVGAELRGCYEGWEKWLDNTGMKNYAAGDLWGCVGAWYAGAWHTQAANGYIDRVRHVIRYHVWLRSDWSQIKPPCRKPYGCPKPG